MRRSGVWKRGWIGNERALVIFSYIYKTFSRYLLHKMEIAKLKQRPLSKCSIYGLYMVVDAPPPSHSARKPFANDGVFSLRFAAFILFYAHSIYIYRVCFTHMCLYYHISLLQCRSHMYNFHFILNRSP